MNKYKNILIIVAGFIVLFLVFKMKWMLSTALIIAIVCSLSSWVAGKVDWAWTKLAEILGYINSKVILSVLFFVFLTPLAFFSRLSGSARKKFFSKSAASIYTERNHEYSAADLESTS